MSKDDLIVSAAIGILARQNYHSMTTSALADAAGIAEGTIYCYFKSKKELFIRVLQGISEKLFGLFFKDVDVKKSLRENLSLLGENFSRMNDEASTLYKILYKSFSEVEDEEIKKELGLIYTKGLERIREIIHWSRKEKNAVPDASSEMVLMMLWGIGDMLWKKLVISNQASAGANELNLIIDFICRWLDRA